MRASQELTVEVSPVRFEFVIALDTRLSLDVLQEARGLVVVTVAKHVSHWKQEVPELFEAHLCQ